MIETVNSFVGTRALLVNEEIVEIDNPIIFKWQEVYSCIQKQVNLKNKYVIKVNLVKTTKDKLYFNVVYLNSFKGTIDEPFIPVGAISSCGKEISCLIVPTGIGASIGGYAGDANPLAKLFASSSKYLLTHPNVVNGAVLSDMPSNAIYLEGFLLDQFLLGKINIIPTKQNKIGVIFDKGISEERLEYEVNVLNALRAFYGCEIIAWTLTDKPINIEPSVNELGFSTGKVENLENVIEKAQKLKEIGATAIAICCSIPDLELNKKYSSGIGVDPIGGIESIISRSVSAFCGLVSAHAPVLLSDEKINYKTISPLSASEYISQTFLPSVISGLRFAPKIIVGAIQELPVSKSLKSSRDISNVIVPYNGFGSPGVFYLNEMSNNVTLVRQNKTFLDVDPKHVNIAFKIADNYIDSLDIEKIRESGVDLNVLKRPIEKI